MSCCSLLSCFQRIADQAYYLTYGYELNATKENLAWALQQKNKGEILKYKFGTYTILEFAVKSGNVEAVSFLIDLGADVEYSPASGMGSIVDFYMDCLEEDVRPNIQVLNLLLDKIPDINAKEAGRFRTLLERALENMAHYKNIHWDVIETLIKRGIKVTKNDYTEMSPFMVLRDAERMGQKERNLSEELNFLYNLATYVELEKKYHPNTNSGLTLEQFKSYASNFSFVCTQAAIEMDCFSVVSEGFSFAKEELKESAPNHEEKKFFYEIEKAEKEAYKIQIEKLKMLAVYRNCFKSLVKEGTFKSCFEEWQLTSISKGLEKQNLSHFLES